MISFYSIYRDCIRQRTTGHHYALCSINAVLNSEMTVMNLEQAVSMIIQKEALAILCTEMTLIFLIM